MLRLSTAKQIKIILLKNKNTKISKAAQKRLQGIVKMVEFFRRPPMLNFRASECFLFVFCPLSFSK